MQVTGVQQMCPNSIPQTGYRSVALLSFPLFPSPGVSDNIWENSGYKISSACTPWTRAAWSSGRCPQDSTWVSLSLPKGFASFRQISDNSVSTEILRMPPSPFHPEILCVHLHLSTQNLFPSSSEQTSRANT